MKEELSNFLESIKFLFSSDGIQPKNEANHARTGENETIFFRFGQASYGSISAVWSEP